MGFRHCTRALRVPGASGSFPRVCVFGHVTFLNSIAFLKRYHVRFGLRWLVSVLVWKRCSRIATYDRIAFGTTLEVIFGIEE